MPATEETNHLSNKAVLQKDTSNLGAKEDAIHQKGDAEVLNPKPKALHPEPLNPAPLTLKPPSAGSWTPVGRASRQAAGEARKV